MIPGAGAYYISSPIILNCLKNPNDQTGQFWVLPAQAPGGALYTMIPLPLRICILKPGKWWGGFAIGGLIFVAGYLATSGVMIEHVVFFSEYSTRFAEITSVKVLFPTLLIGILAVRLDRRYNPIPAIV